MTKKSITFSDRINVLFDRGMWLTARKLLERERNKSPDSHWVITQLGVTYYELRKHKTALRLFQASEKIDPDCPLTLWHLAGTLDALGQSRRAIRIYSKLLKVKTSFIDSLCWESEKWADSLKADCVYRLGVCWRKLGKTRRAENCFRQYLNLLMLGIEGLYDSNDVLRQIHKLHNGDKRQTVNRKLQEVVKATLNGTAFSL